MVATTTLSTSRSLCASTTPRLSRFSLSMQAERTSRTHETIQTTVPAKVGEIAGGAVFIWLGTAAQALAVDREYGILEGATISLVHPAVMLGLFAATIYAGWLGWQWRRLREIGNEIRDLKKQLPGPDAEGNVPSSPIADQIAAFEITRKELAAGGFRDRHWNMGSILLGGGTFIAVFGCVNTYLRTNKLFPGPHLYAGAGIVVLWAIAAALVPSMQKGNDTARTMHIALNAVNVLLFVSQIPTGFEIVGKVLEFAAFP